MGGQAEPAKARRALVTKVIAGVRADWERPSAARGVIAWVMVRGLWASVIFLIGSGCLGTTTVPTRPPPAVRESFASTFPRSAVLRSWPSAEREVDGFDVSAFAIARDGKVTDAQDFGSNVPDLEVRACVVHAFRELEFRPPTGGIVTVVYPITLMPE